MTFSDSSHRITRLLQRWEAGDAEAMNDLVTLVYAELRRLARAQLHREQSPTIQPTELVAEAYLRLVDVSAVSWQGRAHFYSIAARTMRRVLVDRYRHRSAARRNHGDPAVTFDELAIGSSGSGAGTLDLLALEDVLRELEELDARQAEIVTLKFYGGLEGREIGEALGISERTVKREWALAKRWIARALGGSTSRRPPVS